MRAYQQSRRGAIFAIAFLLTLSGFFGMTIPADEYEPQGGMYGGDLRIALKADIEENPLLANDDASLMVVSLLYDSLARINSVDLTPMPWVATEWNVTTDTTVNVSIRTDVEWHDSTDETPHYITAEDIVYTYGSSGMKSSAHWGTMLMGVICTKIDNETVNFNLEGAPSSRGIFESQIMTIPIIPENFSSASSESGSGPFMFGMRGSHDYVIGDDEVVESAEDGQLYAIGGAHYHYIEDTVYDTNVQVDFYKNGTLMTAGYFYHKENGTLDFNPGLNEFEQITANYTITSKFTSIVAFERHFERRPYLDSINYTFFPDNPATPLVDEATDGAAKAMIDQMVDFIGFQLDEGSQNVVRWEGDPDQMKLFDPFLVPHVQVQTENPTFKFLYLGMNTEFIPLDDPLFRRGVSMSIKRELANDYIPTAVIADSVMHPSNSFWYNESVDKFRVPKDQDGNPIYTEIINHFQDSGYLDPDEDGFMEDKTGADFKLRLYVPLSAEDPSASSIGQDIGQTFNDVGIDAETIYEATSDFMPKVIAGNFELYLTTYEVEADPIFLYDILHVDNVPPSGSARNYVRLNNATMNSLLADVKEELDQDSRKYYVQSALAWIASNAPVATILHFNLLEAYEKANYEGWVQMTGGVNNFWSYLYVHYQQKGEMKAQLVIHIDSINSGEILELGVTVTDLIDVPLEGAWVKLVNTYSDEVFINYSDSTGYAGFEWLAPSVSSPTTVDFTATVTIPQYDKEIVENSITVHPVLEELDVTIGVTPNKIQSGGETVVTVEVRDDFSGLPIQGATVILNIVRPEAGPGSFGATTGLTDVNGRFETTFTADVTTSMQFTLDASAVVDGYEPGTSQATSVIVDPIAQPTPGFEAVIVVLAVLLAVVLVGAWRGAKSRKEEE
ncbi:MAG: hypothetical protein JSV43_04320 [Methanobacteriota archaeon]|nr:MAG: hypothetical protein JSV43_04320 [Euryarchaeota archaeon]